MQIKETGISELRIRKTKKKILIFQQVTWRNTEIGAKGKAWNFYSVGDMFTNGASFVQTGRRGTAKPNYNKEQTFKVGSANSVQSMTSSAGALTCSRTLTC
jgi:pectate lyase